jgi:hypothetical protein
MRKYVCALIMVASCAVVFAQSASSKSMEDYKPTFGVKAGYNWSYITGNAEGSIRTIIMVL